MTNYRAAVIGLGRMGSTYDDEGHAGGATFTPYCHGPAYHYSCLTDLVSGADPHDGQRELFGKRWGIASDHMYSDHREMLAHEKLDIVSVTTTAKVRPSIVLDAARAGVKAIWAEKPIAFSLAEADEMVRVCHEHGVALLINTARRWNPFYSEAKRMIDAGELGKIYQVTGLGQCAISHNGSHLIDNVRFLAGGEVEWVFGEMESDGAAARDDDLMGNGYLAFDNGVRGYVRSMPTGAAGREIDVIGEKGRIRCHEGPSEFEINRLFDDGTGARPVPVKLPMPWPGQIKGTGLSIIEDMVQAIETGCRPRASGEDGLAALEIAIAMRESHKKGGVKIRLPMKDRSLMIRSSETLAGDEPVRVRRERLAGGR